MGFVEGLRHQLAAESLRKQQLITQREVKEREKLQREAIEQERRAQRRQQAEDFRKESTVDAVVAELGEFLATPTVPTTIRTTISDGGDGYEDGFTGRGSSSVGLGRVNLAPKDPDSVFDSVEWDSKLIDSAEWDRRHTYIDTHLRDKGRNYSHYSEKFIAVETYPDGTIIFHAGWFGTTTIQVEKWRGNDRTSIFDKALEKAYRNPGTNNYSIHHPYVRPGQG